MTELPHFRYFEDPAGAGAFVRAGLACGSCHQPRGWLYVGPGFGPAPTLHKACPWCIADGSAAARFGVLFNRETSGPVQTAVEDELAHRTPKLISWQGVEWPVCCGDACVFLGYADAEALMGRWPEAGRALLAGYRPGSLGTRDAGQFLACFDGEDPLAYVFRCRPCGRHHVPWDRG